MNKEEFLEKLEEKISILEESEISDIVEEYSEHIDEKIKSGSTEKEAIKEFGDIDELASEILSAYKINKNHSSDRVSNFVDEVIDNVKEVCNKIIKVLSHGSVKDVLKLIIYIFILIVMCAIMKIPFEFLCEVIENAFDILPEGIEKIFDTILSIFINLSYIILAFLFFIKMLKEKMLDQYVEEETVIKNSKSTRNSKKEEKVFVEKKIVNKNEKSFFDTIGDLLLIIIKFLSAFILIPSIIGVLFSSVGFAFMIIFSIKYVAFFGPIILCLGVLCGSIWLTEVIFRFIFNKSGSFTKSFITFIVALVLCGVGFGVSILEVTNLNFTDYNKKEELIGNYNINISSTNNFNVNCYECNKINKTIDENMKNDEIIINVYGASYQSSYYSNMNSDNQYIDIYYSVNESLLFKELINDIKKGNLYDYDNNFEQKYMNIIGNEETLNKINIEYGD